MGGVFANALIWVGELRWFCCLELKVEARNKGGREREREDVCPAEEWVSCGT